MLKYSSKSFIKLLLNFLKNLFIFLGKRFGVFVKTSRRMELFVLA